MTGAELLEYLKGKDLTGLEVKVKFYDEECDVVDVEFAESFLEGKRIIIKTGKGG